MSEGTVDTSEPLVTTTSVSAPYSSYSYQHTIYDKVQLAIQFLNTSQANQCAEGAELAVLIAQKITDLLSEE